MRQLKISKQLTNRESASISKYLQEVAKIDMISPEEEVELANKIKDGDNVALERLVNANLRFVVSVAKQYQVQGMTLEDLINEGNIGLVKAAQRFDPSKGFKFISYAVWWIRQSIMVALGEKSRLVRLPLNKIAQIKRVNDAQSLLNQQLEREPTAKELSEFMDDFDESSIEDVKSISRQPISMDAPVTDDDDRTIENVIVDSNQTKPDDGLINESLFKDLNAMIDRLNHKESLVIKKYYGIGGYEPVSYAEIASLLDISKERVRQIKLVAIRKLKNLSRRNHLEAYLG